MTIWFQKDHRGTHTFYDRETFLKIEILKLPRKSNNFANMTSEPTPEKNTRFYKWLKKVGFWGFLFFLAKGLVWLAVGYWAVK